MLYDVLVPSFVEDIVGYQVSSALGVTYFHEAISLVPAFSSYFFLKICLAGLFFGICSLILIESLGLFERLSHRVKLGKLLKGLIGGLALIILFLAFSRRYLGLGVETIK